jgi:hypothetical protein
MHPSADRAIEHQARMRAEAADYALTRGLPRRRTRLSPPDAQRLRRDQLTDSGDPVAEAILRGGVVLGLAAIALIHFIDLFSKLRETPYLGVAYIGLIIASLTLGARLIRGSDVRLWLCAGALAGATIVGYVLSRAIGLPRASGDIGNWQEPLGLAALFVEGLVVLLSAHAVALLRGGRREYSDSSSSKGLHDSLSAGRSS